MELGLVLPLMQPDVAQIFFRDESFFHKGANQVVSDLRNQVVRIVSLYIIVKDSRALRIVESFDSLE